MTSDEKVEMLMDFAQAAMAEDCTGVALSNTMERVERYLAGWAWIEENRNKPGTDKDTIVEIAEDLEAIEQWWLDGMKDG